MKRSTGEARNGLFLTLFLLAIVTSVAIVPTFFQSAASSKTGEGLVTRTTVEEE